MTAFHLSYSKNVRSSKPTGHALMLPFAAAVWHVTGEQERTFFISPSLAGRAIVLFFTVRSCTLVAASGNKTLEEVDVVWA